MLTLAKNHFMVGKDKDSAEGNAQKQDSHWNLVISCLRKHLKASPNVTDKMVLCSLQISISRKRESCLAFSASCWEIEHLLAEIGGGNMEGTRGRSLNVADVF